MATILRVVPESIYEKIVAAGFLEETFKIKDSAVETALSHIPETLRPKGRELIEFLIKHGVSWDNSGSVCINHENIYNTNIHDMTKSILFGQSNFWSLSGSTEIARLLDTKPLNGNSIVLPLGDQNDQAEQKIESSGEKEDYQKSDTSTVNKKEKNPKNHWITFEEKYSLRQ